MSRNRLHRRGNGRVRAGAVGGTDGGGVGPASTRRSPTDSSSITAAPPSATVGAGRRPHRGGTPRVGALAAGFDGRIPGRPEAGGVELVLDVPRRGPSDLAGIGAGEIRRCVVAASTVDDTPSRKLAYEAVHPWITGMGVIHWETMPDRDQSSATAGASDTGRKESVT